MNTVSYGYGARTASRNAWSLLVAPTVGALGDIDISTCDVCGSAVKVIASIEDPVVIPTALAAAKALASLMGWAPLAGQALKQILAHLSVVAAKIILQYAISANRITETDDRRTPSVKD